MNNNMMNLLNQVMMSGNPQNALQNMIRQNPQLNSLLMQQRQNGMTMEQFTRQIAQQNNVDINPLINMLRNMGVKF